MMFCNACGINNPDNGRYCAGCGKQLFHPGVDAVPQKNYSAPPIVTRQLRQKWKSNVDEATRQVSTSVVFFIALLLYTFVQIINVLSIADVGLVGSVDSLLEGLNLPSTGLSAGLRTINAIGAIPGALTALSLWMIWGGGLSTTGKGVQCAGLGIIYVLQSIACVLVNIIAMFVLLLTISGMEEMSQYTDSANGAVGFALILLLGVLVLINFYFVKILSTISAVRGTLRTSAPNSDVSGFVAVMLIISGALTLLGGVFSGDVVKLLESVSSILFGVSIFVYQSAMSRLEEEQRVYISGPLYAAYPVGNYPRW